ncbi:hypothetical protein jhhlp_005253 [Lomentospora prolificans]|uniref:Uncharacterized protein n=1 Tax=Lomentospora prolificans TaxID=41688 RepID=A0A2N3N792_9PEZI|nr:hypothetical protein jhhlp_005253 [Lomentospora prolificans]
MSTHHHRTRGMAFPLSPESSPSATVVPHHNATKGSTSKTPRGTSKKASSANSKQDPASIRTGSPVSSRRRHEKLTRSRDIHLHDDKVGAKRVRRSSQMGFQSIGAWCDSYTQSEEALVIEENACDGYAGYANAPVPTPPQTPFIGRLDTPDLSPIMPFDTEFQICWDEEQEDRINETWCFSRQSKTEWQLDAALAHIAQTKARDRARP